MNDGVCERVKVQDATDIMATILWNATKFPFIFVLLGDITI
jgi:hypothetical protein